MANRGLPVQQQVADTCLELMHQELVDYVIRTHGKSQESMYLVLENIGFTVGQRLIERLTKERQKELLFKETLDYIRFLCKEFWTDCFRKPVDSLKTNNKGLYQLKDNAFRWLRHIAPNPPQAAAGQYQRSPYDHTIFPAGLIRGALYGLGIQAVVEPVLGKTLPECTFNVTLKNNAACVSPSLANDPVFSVWQTHRKLNLHRLDLNG
eukprot:TRINITY_DN15586_c0_g1_i1.p1 TRINITY_DN15586_c0_g1~~TRINITY_DN15586_c0_g1_i1.p1  ORF type:complete len:208 (+),score=28.64 TRINITY_DN15586_c0_g1_i1:56-679(+)